jgi:hypothetical protein
MELLLSVEIKEKLQKQYQMGSDMEQLVIAKFFNPTGSWSWFAMNMDEDGDYIWGIVDGFEVEMGSFSLSELQAYKGPLGIGIERDLYFKPITAKELWERLMKGEHV